MEDSCPATPLVLTGRDSKSPLQVALSSPESDGMKSPSRDSPDSRCVICLGKLQNKSFTDSCLHQFCFQCLLQWSKIKAECPLCKQPFKSIIHNVRSNLDYDQYHVEHGEPHYVLSDLMHSYNFDTFPIHRRFHYRTTMTREYFRELAESFFAHTRRLPEDSYQISPLVPVDPAPAQGVHRSNRLHAHSVQLRTRQRGTSDFRRNIYAHDLWVQDLPDISGRYRECTPQFYRENPAQIHRIVPWLNREVNVLLSDCESHAAYVLSRLVSLLSQHHIKSREFREIVQPYFGDRTDHFIHELYTFAHSVYDIAGFDQNAVYGTNPNYATEVQEISSSSDDSDIEVLETVKGEEKKSKKSSQGFKKILLKRAGEVEKSGEPVAGPSGISASTSEAIELCESDPDEVKVVDYVKPPPEVVTLSSGDEAPQFSDLDITNGEYAEVINSDDERQPDRDSDEDYVLPSERRKSRYKTGKGKCKSNGFGLKGRQKGKYIKSKRRRSTSNSSTRSGSTSTSSSSRCSNITSRSSSRSRSRSRSISLSSGSSDYKASKLKKKKSKASRKKYKKKSSYKSHSRRHKSVSDPERSGKKKRRVKSCVIVPSWSCDSPSSAPHKSSDEHKRRRRCDRYWSIVPSDVPRVRRSSTERKFKKKGRHRESYGEERPKKRTRDSSSERSTGSESKYSKIRSDNLKINDLPDGSEAGGGGHVLSAHASLASCSTSSFPSAIKLSPCTKSD